MYEEMGSEEESHGTVLPHMKLLLKSLTSCTLMTTYIINPIYLRIAFLFIVISLEHVIFVPSFYPCILFSRNLTDKVYDFKQKVPSSSWILS